MASTGLLKLTYLLQLINVIILPIIGLFVAILLSIITTVFLEVITFGYAEDTGTDQLSSGILAIFLGLALFYLIDTIGLIAKKNLARILSILVNLIIFGLIIYSFITDYIDTGATDNLGILVFSLLYLIPAATLSLHSKTKKLF